MTTSFSANVMRSAMLTGIALLSALSLSGCASDGARASSPPPSSAGMSALGNVEYYTFELANELFAGLTVKRQARYAVTGFVPVTTMVYNDKDQHPLMWLGHQLEQGMITEATKRGFAAQEFKLTNDIIISDHADRVLSRNIEQLSALERVDYYITGTLVFQQAGAMVNARIIDARSKEVMSAATRFFPAELFWETEQVTSRNGRLYRTED